MYSLSDAEDVVAIAWMPELCGLAEMGLVCQKGFKCYGRCCWRRIEEGIRVVGID